MSEETRESRPAERIGATARDAAVRIARELRDRGFTAYFAGGCVRDALLGLEPKDYDVATDARPEQIREIFHRTRGVGQAFGVVLVNLMGHSIEVVTFRADGVYLDGRRPQEVVYADAPSDARRRDFTINGLFEDPFSGEIIDFVGGRDDLRHGVIRAIGSPHDRFGEDRLRMLRAVRFAARFGFEIGDETRDAIRDGGLTLQGVSRERIGHEVQWMLEHPSRAAAAALLQELRLDAMVLEEPSQTCPLTRLAGLPDAAVYGLALAAWWSDRRSADSADAAAQSRWRRALMLSNADEAMMQEILRIDEQLEAWFERSVARRKRLAAADAFRSALILFATVQPQAAQTIEADVEALAETGLAPPPLVDGNDLIAMGLAPGPDFRRILDAVYDAQLEGRVSTNAAAVALAKSLIRRAN